MDLTQILQSAHAGDSIARAKLIEAAYQDLRRLAAGKMSSERQDLRELQQLPADRTSEAAE